MKFKLITLTIALIFCMVFLISFISSATDFSSVFDQALSKGIKADLKTGLFTFSENEGSLSLTGADGKKHEYSDMLAAGEGTNAFIKLASDGSINSLDLTASKDTSIYVNGVDVPLRKGFRAVYDKGNLEVISDSSSDSSAIPPLPKLPETIFKSTPKEITYKSLTGGDLRISKSYTLEDGMIKYSLEKQEFFVPKGQTAVLNGFNINANERDAVLGKNFLINGNSIYSQGTGFDVSFNSGTSTFFDTKETLVSLDNSENGKYFKVGDKGEDITNIQKIVGIRPTGQYDEVTKQAVMKWQSENGLTPDGLFGSQSLNKVYGQYGFDLSGSTNGKYFKMGDRGEGVKEIQSFLISNNYLTTTYTDSNGKTVSSNDGIFGSRTLEAVKKWQADNGLTADGDFGKDSLKRAKNYENNVVVSMQGGSSIIKNGKDGLDVALKGRTALEVGNKKYLFDGVNFNQALVPSLESNVVSTPTKITFEKDNGKDFELTLDTLDKKINSVKLKEAATKMGIDIKSSSCSGFVQAVCPLALEEDGGGIIDSFFPKHTQEGITGPAWQIQQNMLDKGGEVVFSKENQLTPAQTSKLAALKKTANANYNKYLKQGMSEDNARKKASNDIRAELGSILNQDDLNSQVTPLKGDVISFYYKDSGYLSEAIREGENNQKNTHVGTIIGSSEDSISLSGDAGVLSQLRSNLGVSEDALYVNSYTYRDKATGVLQPLLLRNGEFYFEDGDKLSGSSGGDILVNRPQVAHMIHYTPGEANPYHVETLDSVMSRNDLALYGVTRPESSKYLDEAYNFGDIAFKKTQELSCTTLNCGGFNLLETLQANNVPDATLFSNVISKSTLERQKEFNLPDSQLDDLATITNAIIKRETNFGDSEWYDVKKTFKLPITSAGYMQVSGEIFDQYSNEFNDIPLSATDRWTADNTIKYGQRYLSDIIKFYAPDSDNLNKEQIYAIAAAYNSGLYSPRNAAVQKELIEMGYIDTDVKATGSLGKATLTGFTNFAKDNNIQFDPATLTSENLEKLEVYTKIKQEYKLKTGKDPAYAIPPEIKTSDVRGTRTVQGYAEEVYQSFKDFCANCTP